MKIHEYQAKRLLQQHGITHPRGDVATSAGEARTVAAQLEPPFVVKAQVLVGGRGKAGGIRFASTVDETGAVAERILGMSIKGLAVRSVLIEEAARIAREIYLAITVDRAAGCPLVVVSGHGGVDIEEVAQTYPDAIAKVPLDPCIGLRPYHVGALRRASGLGEEHNSAWEDVVYGLYTAFRSSDATLAEINPLVLTASGHLLAVDAKVAIDDSALFRHPELAHLREPDQETDREKRARAVGISYVELDGDIGCLVNGAGLAMATMDAVRLSGGAPANFLDIGGGAKADAVAEALSIILSDSGVRAILANVFGGITRCDEVATGIVAGMQAAGADTPLVVRLQGTNEAEGRRVLGASRLSIYTTDDLVSAACKVTDLARARAAR